MGGICQMQYLPILEQNANDFMLLLFRVQTRIALFYSWTDVCLWGNTKRLWEHCCSLKKHRVHVCGLLTFCSMICFIYLIFYTYTEYMYVY